ncbi:hypothetical protein LIER_40416 [Lithospermum erythrorhizon]|uniref:Uncharacterized protein n=1 Tax=Lithospermum erythrorhizon TaxID=34254 RepID=A0AAV3QWD1_LITER
MEGKNQSFSSSSSAFTSDLFGSKGTTSSSGSSSSDVFSSIFKPPSKVHGPESVQPDGGKVVEKPNQGSAAVYWNSRMGISDDTDMFREAGTRGVPNMNAYYQEEKAHPCHYSSSIYYGGQDVYSRPKSTTQSSSYTSVNKDNGEDDSESASRGNWWQGSLYY